ncbi:DNA topoisomerase I, mitochondrial [Copidosoma floridanum]|uniref:DNA topoisomerase I, mitochondrial n=1 Tax=Copidosoma floridanum TaxID=29053 RepID=UPI0006C98821|nr:DNA topoisomerase I, mitochondrial [Copidosoma floridanum]
MEVELPVSRAEVDPDKKAKENSSAAGNHGDAQMNGMTNGYEHKKEHKSEYKEKDKERSHKSEHKDKERSKDKEKSHKSEHRDKDRHKDKHSSSSSKDKSKEKHSSSSSKDKEKSRDKDKESKDKKSSSSSRDKDKEHKSSSVSSNRDKERSKDHKSSSSSKDKDKHHSSSSKDKERNKDKDKERHKDRHSSSQSSSRDKDKEKEKSSKDKEKKHSSDKDKERHSSSHSSEKHKEKSSPEKDKKDRDKHRHDKEKSKHRDEKEKKEKIKEEPKIKEELVIKEESDLQIKSEVKIEVKVQQESFKEADDDYDSGDDSQRLYIKEEDEEMKEENSLDSTADTRLSEMYNSTMKTEEESDEDKPLSSRSTPGTKRKALSDSDDDIPLAARKKPKKEPVSKKKRKKKDSEDEDDYEEPEEKPKKKRKPNAKENNTSTSSQPSPKKKKKEEEEQEVWKWWEEEKRDDGTKWHFLEHKGPVFAPLYEPLPSSVKFYYNGKEMKLSIEAEEIATFYGKMLEHDYTTKQVFNDNFFHDWREVMTDSERSKITDLKKCNFTEINKYFTQKSEERKAMSKEEKKAIKEQNEEIQKEYGICTIDGHKEKIGNFKIEPPGLFRGRGEHPKMGKLKKRVVPEDVLINCSKDSLIPKPPPGHKWREVRHDPTVTWLASWTENVQGQVKYVMLNPSSKLKGEKDWQKYETARKLAKSVDKIRSTYRDDWKSKEMRVRQRAVALYFIDRLALRAGNEKDEDQADTVGCCSLRVEHIKLHEEMDGKEFVVEFDFLGKDSIRYYNKVPVEKRVFKSLQLFMDNKAPSDELFDRLNTTIMNKHLNELMEGLTAKVFRTFNASWTLQQQLDKLTDPDSTVAEKILSYNRANRAVAILCNHQRAVPKTHGKSMENLKGKIDAKKEVIAEAEKNIKGMKQDAKRGSVKEKVLYEKKKKQLEKLKEQLHKLELQVTDKEENKEIALGTSKLNYLDPRISVAWCKKHDVPIEKIYNKTQRDKFRWAIDMAGADYVF